MKWIEADPEYRQRTAFYVCLPGGSVNAPHNLAFWLFGCYIIFIVIPVRCGI